MDGTRLRQRWKAGLIGAALALATGLAASQTVIPLSDSPLDAAELFDRVAPSIWVVMTVDTNGRPLSSGSAVVIATDTLVTNCHVLAQAASASVRRGNIQFQAEQAETDSEHDVCLLRVRGLQAPSVLLAREDSLRPGMRVYAVGAPRRLEQTISDGLLSGLRRDTDGSLMRVQTSAPISPGSSGGGLFDAHGRLIGITTSGLKDSQSLNFAMPGRFVEALSRRSGQPQWYARTASPDALASATPPSRSAPAKTPEVVAPALPPVAPPRPTISAPVAAAAPQAPRENTPPDAPGDVPAQHARWTQIEYVLRDRLTGLSRNVVYRADPWSREVTSFNNGGWTERSNGEVIGITAPIAGEFDGAMPPGGWVRSLRTGEQSRLKYTIASAAAGTVSMDLRAEVVGTEDLEVAGRQVHAVRVDFQGYVSRMVSVAGASRASGTYRATAWWSPELARVVRFTVHSRGGASGAAFQIEESLELVSIQ